MRRRAATTPPPRVPLEARLSRALTEIGEFGRLAYDIERPKIISTGIDSLDGALGIGGLPLSRASIFHGPEAVGKTTLALEFVRQFQEAGGLVLYMDHEHKLDMDYAAKLGVDLRALIIAHPPYIEKGFELLERAGNSLQGEEGPELPVLFVWDSLQAVPGRRTFEAEYGKDNFSPEAAAYSKCLQKFMSTLDRIHAHLLMISQVRMKMGQFGASEKVAVGQAPLFYASHIVMLRSRKAKGSVTGEREGEEIEAYVRKNSVARPYRIARFNLVYGKGIDKISATFAAAEAVGLVTRPPKGAWWSMDLGEGPTKLQGLTGFKAFAAESPVEFEGLRALVREKMLNSYGEKKSVEVDDASEEAALEDADDAEAES